MRQVCNVWCWTKYVGDNQLVISWETCWPHIGVHGPISKHRNFSLAVMKYVAYGVGMSLYVTTNGWFLGRLATRFLKKLVLYLNSGLPSLAWSKNLIWYPVKYTVIRKHLCLLFNLIIDIQICLYCFETSCTYRYLEYMQKELKQLFITT
jgi:hypothetical protein